jgi:hypothetical protein
MPCPCCIDIKDNQQEKREKYRMKRIRASIPPADHKYTRLGKEKEKKPK